MRRRATCSWGAGQNPPPEAERMLTLTRKVGESIHLGNGVRLVVAEAWATKCG